MRHSRAFQTLGARIDIEALERERREATERRSGPGDRHEDVHVHRHRRFDEPRRGPRRRRRGSGCCASTTTRSGRLVASGGGEIVNSTGDGFFVAFESARAGDRVRDRDPAGAASSSGRRPGSRWPSGSGCTRPRRTAAAADYSGMGVHVAARVAALAGGGEILATSETLAEAGDRRDRGLADRDGQGRVRAGELRRSHLELTASPMAEPTTVDEYLATLSDAQRANVELMRAAINAAAPDATETIAYSMPALRTRDGQFPLVRRVQEPLQLLSGERRGRQGPRRRDPAVPGREGDHPVPREPAHPDRPLDQDRGDPCQGEPRQGAALNGAGDMGRPRFTMVVLLVADLQRSSPSTGALASSSRPTSRRGRTSTSISGRPQLVITTTFVRNDPDCVPPSGGARTMLEFFVDGDRPRWTRRMPS